MPFKLSPDIAKQIAELASDLHRHHGELRDDYDNRSERWRTSDEGGEVDAWLDSLENLIDDLDSFPEKPEG